MKTVLGVLVIVVALTLTVGGGMLQGSYARRWGTTEHEMQLASRLEQVPEQFAGWTKRESYEISDAAQRLLQPSGFFNRSYVGPNGEQVGVAVMLGAHGPISVHTPEVCYSSRDYKQLATRETVAIKDVSGDETQFWKLTFKSNNVDQSGLRVYYAWSTDLEWKAAKWPRYEYFGQPYLFKIQLASRVNPDSADADDDDACRRFLKDFVPVLKQQLFDS